MSHDDFETEPLPGLPERPPAGETILWQGAPHWPTVARRVMHVDLVAAYFAVVIGWRFASSLKAGVPLRDTLLSTGPLIMLAGVAIGILSLIAWGIGRTTIYTITSRRIAMRFGIALPVTFNLPYREIEAAGVRKLSGGHGDIALTLSPGTRLAYFVLWPHVRPWRLRSPEPTLRAIPEIDRVADILAKAIAATAVKSKPVSMPSSNVEPHAGQPALVAAE